eukprot:2925767-Rhodomonas_salina.2
MFASSRDRDGGKSGWALFRGTVLSSGHCWVYSQGSRCACRSSGRPTPPGAPKRAFQYHTARVPAQQYANVSDNARMSVLAYAWGRPTP